MHGRQNIKERSVLQFVTSNGRLSDTAVTSGSFPMETTKQSKFDYHGDDSQFLDHVGCVVFVVIS